MSFGGKQGEAREVPPGESSQNSRSSHTCPPDESESSAQGEFNFSFGARNEDELSIAALEGGLEPSDADDSAEPAPFRC